MRRMTAILLALALCVSRTCATAELSAPVQAEAAPVWERVPGLICPGAEQEFVCTVTDGAGLTVSVTDIAGTVLQTLLTDWEGGAFLWDGWGL